MSHHANTQGGDIMALHFHTYAAGMHHGANFILYRKIIDRRVHLINLHNVLIVLNVTAVNNQTY